MYVLTVVLLCPAAKVGVVKKNGGQTFAGCFLPANVAMQRVSVVLHQLKTSEEIQLQSTKHSLS